MSTARFLVGDVFDRLREIPDGSVDLVLTSPPFLALRSYLPAGHPDKGREIGGEPTPAAFIDTLLALTVEWRRVLAPHGSLCVELGDTYSGSGGAGGDYAAGGLRDGQERFSGSASRTRADGNGKVFRGGERQQDKSGNGWPLAKSICGIPWLYSLSLAYGRNLLREPMTAQELLTWIDDMRAVGMTADAALAHAGSWWLEHGTPQRFDPWRVRNVVAWCRPNPPVGALGDKFRPATSYMTIACTSGSRYFDLDAVRTPSEYHRDSDRSRPGGTPPGQRPNMSAHTVNPAGAPPLDYWEIPTQPYAGTHYAAWPLALLERPIRSMCPERVCTTCGAPSERIIDSERRTERDATQRKYDGIGSLAPKGFSRSAPGGDNGTWQYDRTTIGWTDCGHNAWRPGHVLDPFGGSGTTAVVATGHGRSCTLIDIDHRNADLARERVGMLLEVEEPRDAA